MDITENNFIDDTNFCSKYMNDKFISKRHYKNPSIHCNKLFDKPRNFEYQDTLHFGVPSRLYTQKFKSNDHNFSKDIGKNENIFGYKNPFEHYFQLNIDSNLQNPDNVVLPFPRGGISSRLDKKIQLYQ